MDTTDLRFVVCQHRHHFPDGFFVRLGRDFLTEYYRAFLTSPDAHTEIAELNAQPVGYLVGVVDPVTHRQHVVRRHGRALIVKAVAAMARRPALGVIFARTRARRYAVRLRAARRAAVTAPQEPPAGRVAVLAHVAVMPTRQSHGIGSALIDRFERRALAAGRTRLTLVTAAGENGAGRYYLRRGWDARGEHVTPEGDRLATYERALGGPGFG